MKRFLLLFSLLLSVYLVMAQNIAITDDAGYQVDSSAMLDIKSTTKGLLMPRLTTVQRNAVINPATGLLVFDTDQKAFYFYDGTSWLNVSSGGTDLWVQSGANVHLADSTSNVGVGTNAPQNKFIVQGNPSSGINEAIFAVVGPGGDTLFAVYPEGTRVYVKDEPAIKSTSSRSGFAVGGYSMSKGATNEYLRVTPDSVRIFVDDNPAAKSSSTRGGFAVGGFSMLKGQTNEYLRVTPDSVRVYIDADSVAKATNSKGGFAVGGFSLSKGVSDSLYLFSDKSGLNVSYLTQAERDAITDPRISSIIFNTTDSCLQIYLGYWESIWCTPMNCIYPTINTQPADFLLEQDGGDAMFTTEAYGSKLYYKWQESNDGGITWKVLMDGGSNPSYSGCYSDSLILTNVPLQYNSYQYRCLIVNACGAELTLPAQLYVWECGQAFTDSRDSKSYNTVLIGSQCWMQENLDIGLMINSTVGGQLQTDNSIIEKYCYDNNLVNCNVYGGLYEWGEMMDYNSSDAGNPGTTQGICPSGWHVPTDGEWNDLFTYLGGIGVSAGKMKETGTTHWSSPNSFATNLSGFTALPGGHRHYNLGEFSYLTTHADFSSATEFSGNNQYYMDLHYSYADVLKSNDFKTSGFSVRCIKIP